MTIHAFFGELFGIYARESWQGAVPAVCIIIFHTADSRIAYKILHSAYALKEKILPSTCLMCIFHTTNIRLTAYLF